LRSVGRVGDGAGVIELRALTVDDWRQWRDLRLAALGEAPYAFGSTLADWRGAAEDRWRARLDGGSLNLLADLDGVPSGMVTGVPPGPDGTAELISMWVAPTGRGRGVGDALIGSVVRWSAEGGARRLALDVVADNGNAVGLYGRHGFVDVGEADEEGERRMIRPLP
jgi:ribosomal protein S18 acetylase RimI-like enzyme